MDAVVEATGAGVITDTWLRAEELDVFFAFDIKASAPYSGAPTQMLDS